MSSGREQSVVDVFGIPIVETAERFADLSAHVELGHDVVHTSTNPERALSVDFEAARAPDLEERVRANATEIRSESRGLSAKQRGDAGAHRRIVRPRSRWRRRFRRRSFDAVLRATARDPAERFLEIARSHPAASAMASSPETTASARSKRP